MAAKKDKPVVKRIADTQDEVPLTFLPCRSFRHETRHVTDKVTRGVGREVIEFTRITQCAVCGAEIHTTYGVPDFRVKSRRYYYKDLYRVRGGMSVFDARAKYVKAILK